MTVFGRGAVTAKRHSRRTPRRGPIPLTAGLPDWLLGHHPVGLALLGLSLLLATALMIDEPLYRIGAGLDPCEQAFFRVVTELGNSAWKILMATGMVALFHLAARHSLRPRAALLFRHGAALAGFVLACVIGSGVLVNILKRLIGRARPEITAGEGVFSFLPFEKAASWASFPSGHSTTIFALAVALCCLFPRLRLVFLTVAIWVACSRVMIGVHWASDVIAGAALGTATTLMLRHWFAQRGWAFVWRAGVFARRADRLGALLWQRAAHLPGRINKMAVRSMAKAVAAARRRRAEDANRA